MKPMHYTSLSHARRRQSKFLFLFLPLIQCWLCRKLQALFESSAIAQQVEEIASSIAQDEDDVQQADRQRALSTLVELKRLEQLKAIATSEANSTYFFGDKAALGGGAEASFVVDFVERLKGQARTRALEQTKDAV